MNKIKSVSIILLLSFLSSTAIASIFPVDYSTWLINGKIEVFTKQQNVTNSGYAVIIGGGPDGFLWNGCVEAYQYLIYAKGYRKDHVYVAYNTADLLSGRKVPLDLDFDGQPDIKYELDKNKTNIENKLKSIFNEIASKITKNDNFTLFIAAHGLEDKFFFGGDIYLTYSSFLKPELNKINAKHIYIVSGSCYSGSMIGQLKKENRTIITCTSANKKGNAGQLGEFFTQGLFPATLGYDCETAEKIQSDSIDINKDGKISLEEAFVYTKDHDGSADPIHKNESWYEIPRFWSSESSFRYCRDEIDGIVNQKDRINGTENVDAMYLLNANNTIGSNANVTYSSGKYIRLKKGFRVMAGGKFKTAIIDCESEKQQNPAELRSKTYLTEEEEIAEEVTEESVASIEVAPNSSNGIFTVTLGEAETDITLMDIQGRVLKSYNHVSGNFEIDITDAPNGMYLMVLASDSFKVTRKIVKY